MSLCPSLVLVLCAGSILTPPSIWTDLLVSCRPTLASVLLSTPEIVSHALKTTPELLALVLRGEPSLLALAFALVPQLLSETLETHPEFFLDVALRRPALITRLFATHPDMLMAPLEANPTLFSSFLVRHRAMLPDLSASDFHPLLFQLESTKYATTATQTSTRLAKRAVTPLRVRELLLCQEEEMLALVRTPHNATVAVAVAAADDASVTSSRKLSSMATFDAPPSTVSSDNDASHATTTALLSPSEVVREIARLYVAKVHADACDDSSGRARQELGAFAKDMYLVELGFSAAAHAKLASLVRSASREAANHSQEKVRIQWFLRFIRAAPAAMKPTPIPPPMRLHRMALDFYLLAVQRLIPREQLQLRLGDEPYHACLVAVTAFREFVDEPLVSRLLASPAQRQQLLVLQVPERDTTVLVASAEELTSRHVRRRDSTLSVQLQHAPVDAMLHVDDILDATMRVWLQYQSRCGQVDGWMNG